MKQTLLIEIGTEELPPKALLRLSQKFSASIVGALTDAGLDIGAPSSFATPRRLAVSIAGASDRTADQNIEKLGPAVDKAFDSEGKPSPAANGFARSCGVSVSELEHRQTDKGKRLAYQGIEPGKPLAEILPEVVGAALKALPIPKRMRWGTGTEAFVRPVHWIVALHGSDVLPVTLFGCNAGQTTWGHRFHCGQQIELSHADDYADRLRNPGHVVASFADRRQQVLQQVQAAAEEKQGEALVDEALLDEVTALVEWPVAIAGEFDTRFLVLPREALIATLQGHQRYFPVAGKNGELLPCFVTVANLESRDPTQVIAGNERVVRPRLSDALFFWEIDRKRGLEAYAEELDGVSFERSLGSIAEKSGRVAALANVIAQTLGVAPASVARAAALAKADLLTEMVGEFPELQGTMGHYYALDADEDPAVAQAIEEQYYPRHAGAELPASDTGRVLALAEKLDTLAAIFSIGKRPSGDKDPFALRRAALGALRIAIEGGLNLDFRTILEEAVNNQPVGCESAEVTGELVSFLSERLRAYLAEQGIESAVFEAVVRLGFNNPLDFQQRAQAVRGFLREPDAENLCAAHKRIRNILKESQDHRSPDPALFNEPAETRLYAVSQKLQADVSERVNRAEYGEALHQLAQLQAPVDAFFDEVMVMSEDEAVKANRLALLNALDQICRCVADISRLSADA